MVDETASGHSQIDGPTEVVDLDKTTQNKAIVTAFIDDVLVNETAGRFTRTATDQGLRTKPFTGRLDFDEVQFKYNEKAPDLIDHLSFSLMPGSSTALVGVSGAGKTTIGNLAAGLLEATGGRVLFDSVLLSDFAEGVIENGLGKGAWQQCQQQQQQQRRRRRRRWRQQPGQ